MRRLYLLGVLLLISLSAHAQSPAPAAPNPHTGVATDAAHQKKPPLRQDPALPQSTIVVSVVDATGKPIKNRPVRLLQKFRSIAQGEADETFTKSTGDQGEVRFDSLASDTAHSYQATVTEGPAVYASPVFNLREGGGQRVVLSIYKVTRNINEARVGMRGLAYIQPRDDVFQFEFWFQIFSAGPLTWVPENVTFALPEGSKAFTAQDSTGDLRVEELPNGRAVLLGTVSPGRHDVRFSLQVESEHVQSESFDLSLLPHVAEFRVVVESSPEMRLIVPGFPPVQVSEGPNGNRVLVTQARKEDLRNVHVQIAGLPTRGSAPWIAVSLALLAALSGIFAGGRADDEESSKRRSKEAKKARELLLEELVLLERQRQAGTVGPRTYEQARVALLNAVGRLLEAKQALSR